MIEPCPTEYQECVGEIGDRAGDFSQMLRTKEAFPLVHLIGDALQEFPQVATRLILSRSDYE